MGDGDEQARIGSALGCHTDRRRDVRPALDFLARFGADGQMDSRVWPCSVALLAVEILDEGGEGVEVAARGVPTDQDFARVRPQVQRQHLLLVVHVYLDLLGRLGVGDGIAVADFDLGAVLTAGAKKGSNDTFLVGGAAQRVIEDGKNGLCKGLSICAC